MKTSAVKAAAAVMVWVVLGAASAAEMGAATQAAERKAVKLGLGNPRAIAVDAVGTIYVAEADSGKIDKITRDGVATFMEGVGAIQAPLGLAINADGMMAAADSDNVAVYRVSPKGEVKSVGSKDGEAKLSGPISVAIDAAGNIFVANNADATILKITPDGASSVFAGKADATGSVDGAGGEARFQSPRGIAVDGKGNLYVADEGNSTIRKITPAGEVTTLAGKAGEVGSTDGTGAVARFNAPRGLAAATDGTVYVADTDNETIRKITPEGAVTTLAGKAGLGGKEDGAGSAARFNGPRGVAVDGVGNVLVADSDNAAVREISPAGMVRTIAAAEVKE